MKEVKAIQISAFRRDSVVKVWCGASGAKREVAKRGRIVEFSDRCRSRLLFTAFNASCDWLGYAVLTYPMEFPTDGRRVKRDINVFCKWLEREFQAKYLWGLEFQVRGAPHINFLADQFIPKGLLSRRWYEIVGSGDLNHLSAGTRVEYTRSSEHAAAYIAACYSAKKSVQKNVPEGFENVGRFWGCSRGIVVPSKEGIFLIDDAMPGVRTLRKFTEKSIKPRKCQPMNDGNLRKRKVNRKSSSWLHRGLQGFKTFKGAEIAKRLIESADRVG